MNGIVDEMGMAEGKEKERKLFLGNGSKSGE